MVNLRLRFALSPITPVHEYMSQGIVTETVGGTGVADYRRSVAEAAAARARLEVSRRGLVATVVEEYYNVLAADAKVAVADRALAEASRFGAITRQREAGGEVAHADVVRADLQEQQRRRELNDAALAADKARVDLGVLLFPDPTTQYSLAAALDHMPSLPAKAEIDAAAKSNNPDVRAAFEALRAADYEVASSRFGYTPDLSLGYSYGIDAPEFAVHGHGWLSQSWLFRVGNVGHSGLGLARDPQSCQAEHNSTHPGQG